MRIRWFPLIRDVVLLWVLTGIGGVVSALFVEFGDLSFTDAPLLPVIGFIFGTIAFLISGLLTVVGRWNHLIMVATVGWLTSAVNILFGVTPEQWFLTLPLIGLMALIGGGIAQFFGRSARCD